jgi:hypothetical protein
MKRIIEDADTTGLDALVGEVVLLLCANYFYTGKLTGVSDTFVELTDTSIVYETGEWSSRTYKDAQKLPVNVWFVQRAFIESFGKSK